jgi:hypothetical protein
VNVAGPIILPPELPGAPPPTGEEAPEAVLFMRVYAGFMMLCHLALFIVGVFVMVQPQLSATPAAIEVENVIAGAFYMVWGLGFAVPWVVLLAAGRRGWAHTMGSILVAFSMLNMCCLPAAIPLLIAWNKPLVRRYFTA